MMNKKSPEHSRNFFFFLGFKAHWWIKNNYTWAPPEQFFAFSPKNTDFLKKMFNMKTFIIKFVIRKITLNFGIR